MFERRRLLGVLLCVLCLVGSGSAKIISVTFAHATSGSPGQMEPTDLAGAPGIRVANWNNLTNLNRTLGDDEAVVYDDGPAVDGIGISIDTPRNWSNRDNNNSYQNDQIMYNGVIDCFNDITTLTLMNVPFDQYDVYFYMRDDGASRAGSFTLLGGPTYYLRGTTGNPTADGEGYVLSTDTTMTAGDNASIDPGNYAVFQGLSGDSVFEITAVNAGDGTMRNKWAGFQIVGTVDPHSSRKPSPADEATDVSRDAVLSWTGSQYTVTHDVYFSTDFDDVASASPDALVAPGQDVNVYDPGILTFGQTYYWRIVEVNGPPDFARYEGNVWSFEVEPFTYPVANVTASASIPTTAGNGGPEKIIDGSGLGANDLHSIDDADMWLGDVTGEPAWLLYDFDRVYKLHEMRLWNYDINLEPYIGFGIKDVTIEYAVDADNWIALGDFEIGRGPGIPYAGMSIDLDGIAAQSIRINIHSNWGGQNRYGLSEVRFYQIPVYAREPEPADGAADVGINTALSWRSGREAATHQVYFSTDVNAVADGTALFDSVAASTYDLPTLDLGTTYCWRIVEVNEAETPTSWASNVWSFSTPESVLVDGFEDYTDDAGGEIFSTWADGYNDNSNGSQVGHDNPPYAEQVIVHSGAQSMPMRYGQGGATTSEATMTLPAPADWTAGGATTLVLYFRGDVSNAPGQLFVKINGIRVDYPGAAASLAAPLWTQWNIDLAALGNAAKNVSSMTIGVAGSGSGLLYVDDIRLYREAPPQPEPPVNPGTANLVALYTMEDSLADASGHGYDGTAQVGASFAQGIPGYGKALELDGTSGHATLPIGPLVQSLSSATFATWVNWTGSGSQWCRVFDFGSSTDVYMFATPNASGGTLRFAITTGSSGAESQLSSGSMLPGGWHHVAATIDGAAMTMALYQDGEGVASGPTETLPQDLGNTTQNYLGRSQWADPYLPGSIDDFRIYDRVLSAGEIRYLVGDR
ncbi:MAG: hypothetical protein JW993_10915 [Sedimentisphaerales bacterium]|nr:hypothetical protein [Sedimentisphaerales bacterium]